jgi:peptidoglycan/LPS O-acetylase OafA/YrhL
MIQRVQSIFLLLAALANLGAFTLPLGAAQTTQAASPLFADGMLNLADHWGLQAAFGLAAASVFIAIFLFKNRPLQINLTRIGIVAVLAGAALGIYFMLANAGAQWAYGWAAPLLAIVFSAIAIRAIRNDEKLVKSMDRLR